MQRSSLIWRLCSANWLQLSLKTISIHQNWLKARTGPQPSSFVRQVCDGAWVRSLGSTPHASLGFFPVWFTHVCAVSGSACLPHTRWLGLSIPFECVYWTHVCVWCGVCSGCEFVVSLYPIKKLIQATNPKQNKEKQWPRGGILENHQQQLDLTSNKIQSASWLD